MGAESYICSISLRMNSTFPLNQAGYWQARWKERKKKKKRQGTDPIQKDCIYQYGFLRTVSGHFNANTKLYIQDSAVVSKKQNNPRRKN